MSVEYDDKIVRMQFDNKQAIMFVFGEMLDAENEGETKEGGTAELASLLTKKRHRHLLLKWLII